MFRRTAIAAVVVSLSTFAVASQAALSAIEKGHLKIEGVAKPGLGPFSGESGDISGKEEGGKVVFSTDLRKLKMGLREGHTKEVFEVEKFPTAKLVIEKSKLKIPADNELASGDVSGMLTLHGATNPVKVTYTVKRTGSDFHVKEAKFSFRYTDFKVDKICKLGVCVDPLVSITVGGVKLRDSEPVRTNAQ